MDSIPMQQETVQLLVRLQSIKNLVIQLFGQLQSMVTWMLEKLDQSQHTRSLKTLLLERWYSLAFSMTQLLIILEYLRYFVEKKHEAEMEQRRRRENGRRGNTLDNLLPELLRRQERMQSAGSPPDDEIDENPLDLSNKSGQDKKQSEDSMLGEQVGEKNSEDRKDEETNDVASASTSSIAKEKHTELINLNKLYGNRTFSTFSIAEQNELQLKALRIYNGAEFQSFDEFQEFFEAYKIVGNYPYRVASSELFRDGDAEVIKRFKYKYMVFHCAHYGAPRKRGNGKRPNQNYLSLGCEARFRLNYDMTKGCLRISSFHEEHTNHENSEEDYLRVINRKRKNPTGGSGSKVMETEDTKDSNSFHDVL